MGSPRKRVAVIGASGIGRHHANWWSVEGAEVCGFVGRTPETVKATAARLETLLGYPVAGYTDVAQMLEASRPDIVDVCSPPHLHLAHCRAGLEAGADVLCEKPFAYDPQLSPPNWLEGAAEVVALASRQHRTLALCTQYTMAARICREARKWATASRFEAVLRAPARGRSPDPHFTWADLAPHLFGALVSLFPGCSPLWETLEIAVAGYDVIACFDTAAADGKRIVCRFETGFNVREPLHTRRLVLDDDVFDLLGDHGPDGLFRTRLVHDGEVTLHPDTLRLLIRRFLAGDHPLPGRLALENLEWTVAVLARLPKLTPP